tara:strand:- start:1914 stop:2810 length:897 start_codon:yes stop_codon:yes gene_type:complete
MESAKLVSVIMTCHNGETFLKNALESIINQTYSNWELIFYDNCSTDSSEAILNKYNDTRVKYFKSENLVNLGIIRNLAFKKCQGEFVCFLDVDDYWSKLKLQKQIEKFKTNENLDVLYTNYNKVKNLEITKTKKNLSSGYCQKEIIASYIKGEPLTAWLTLMIKKSSMDKLEYSFDENTHIASDFDLIIRLSVFCNFDYNEEYLAFYRLHGKNETNNKKKQINKEFVYIIDKYKKNKEISNLFKEKNFANKIYIKYLIFQKLSKSSSLDKVFIESKILKLIFFIIKITPKKILNHLIK